MPETPAPGTVTKTERCDPPRDEDHTWRLYGENGYYVETRRSVPGAGPHAFFSLEVGHELGVLGDTKGTAVSIALTDTAVAAVVLQGLRWLQYQQRFEHSRLYPKNSVYGRGAASESLRVAINCVELALGAEDEPF